MKFLKLAAIFSLTSVLFGCAPSGKKTAEEFLQKLSNGNSTSAQNFCVLSDAKSNPLNAVRSWKILSEQSEDEHKLVTARIDSSDAQGQTITKDWKFEVWKTEDAIANNRKVFDSLRQKGIQVTDTSPNRSDWSPNSNCVVIQELSTGQKL
ncbi:MAG: hypothetical protein KME12_13575 [Trichocoleus desertorum ATA4-8-CV12]|jgi:hypothetical protein|nr:hypothetical protein [Trichocoleus desertorum ATA4-8-CV12]